MKIKLITKELYEELLKIQQKHPILTLQNKGYETPNKNKFSTDDMKALNRVNTILEKHIVGFSEFSNFKLRDSENTLLLRVQYDWEAEFTIPTRTFIGVGYLELEELYKGFKTK